MLRFEHRLSEAIPELFFSDEPQKFAKPTLVFLNHALLDTLDITLPSDVEARSQLFSAQTLPDSAKPAAQAYAGHQFGHFNPQLGDGRAHIIGELKDREQGFLEWGFKGSGATPFSRGGDGKAALAPMLREVLLSESMHALGVPSTRSLAVCATGEPVYRERTEKGAVLTRLAASHIRIGTFQFFAARNNYDVVERLCNFCMQRHYAEDMTTATNIPLALLDAVIQKQASLVAKWMSIGFIHGVMNTDNMLISGETIDYGPCAFMETYDPNTVYSSIDRNGRYAYANQPGVAQWNLSRFAETLLPLIDADKEESIRLATESVKRFTSYYEKAFRACMTKKLGLDPALDTQTSDEIINEWLLILQQNKLDFTLAHRELANLHQADSNWLNARVNKTQLLHWRSKWEANRDSKTSNGSLNLRNPLVIARNHLVEYVLSKAADTDSYEEFHALFASLQKPFDVPHDADYYQAAPAEFDKNFVTFCGT